MCVYYHFCHFLLFFAFIFRFYFSLLFAAFLLYISFLISFASFCIGDGTNAAGTLTRWVRDTFYEEELKKERAGGENAYAVMAREAAEVEAGSEGLIILPYIYGERSPIQDAKASGMLFGLKGTHTRKQINRAALEAVGYSTLQHMILFDEMNLPPKSVITAGGGTKNAAWMPNTDIF